MVRMLKRLSVVLSSVVFLGSSLLPAAASADPVITGHPMQPDYFPTHGMAVGSDGAMWYPYVIFPDIRTGDPVLSGIGRITTSGSITTYQLSMPNIEAGDITAGPDGALWFSTTPIYPGTTSYIGRITNAGDISYYPVPVPTGSQFNGTAPTDIVTGPDGALWFTEAENHTIDRISTDGTITTYPVTTDPGADLLGITNGPDGALWFTESCDYGGGDCEIGRITTSGVVTSFSAPGSNQNITTGPDGALWYTTINQIGRLATDGSVTLFDNTAPGTPWDISVGPDGQLWYNTRLGGVNNPDSYIASMNTSGTVTSSYAVGGPGTQFLYSGGPVSPGSIVTGPDGALWYPMGINQGLHQTRGYIVRLGSIPAPSAPTNLTAQSPTKTPQLSWDAVPGATFYNIYRGGSLIDTISSSNTSYTDNMAPLGSDGYYVTATNAAGESDPSNTVTVSVVDPTPVVGVISAPATVAKNSSLNASASFTYPLTSDTHTATWNWGDGTTTNGTVTEANGSGTVTGSHTYTTAGSYTVTLTVTDENGKVGTSQFTVAVSPKTTNTFKGANLSGLNYSNANLSGVDVSGANVQNVTFNFANLQGTNFAGDNASGASFQNANLTSANLSGANFQRTNLTGANLTGANLKGSNFKNAVVTNVTWSNTICPDNTNSDSHGSSCVGHGGGL